jgi:hypothetical protein
MHIRLLSYLTAFSLLTASIGPAYAQVPTAAPADTTKKYANPAGVSAPVNKPFLKSKLFKAVAIPAVLITYGAITAQGFLAASIVHTEFRDKSQWYGIGAYTIATSVAALRMINDKHWQSDVVAGAGFGILSAHLAYLSHRNRWGRKSIGRDIGMTPAYFGNGASGLSVSWRPKK